MRLIDANILEKEGWSLCRTYQQDKETMVYEVKAISEINTAQPERKSGEWTKDNACQFCGYKPWFERDIHTLSFCPNCGADMKGEEE